MVGASQQRILVVLERRKCHLAGHLRAARDGPHRALEQAGGRALKESDRALNALQELAPALSPKFR
jgi:hypothetical protein